MLSRLFPCCCPPAEKRLSRARSVKLQEEDIALPAVTAEVEGDDEVAASDRPSSAHRLTVHARRRAAITSEKTEQLASARWHSAFDALRRSEAKST